MGDEDMNQIISAVTEACSVRPWWLMVAGRAGISSQPGARPAVGDVIRTHGWEVAVISVVHEGGAWFVTVERVAP
jgi:hypothetical protein